LINSPAFIKLWSFLKNDVRISALGASTYGARDAMSAIKSGLFDLVQIEWNLLNQSVLLEVEEEAIKRGVKIALRSIFLQGVLTQEGNVLPVKLSGLNSPRVKAEKVANQLGLTLNCLAFLAALEQKSKPFVLVGVDRRKQLEDLVIFSKNQALPKEARVLVSELNVSDNPLVDPRNW
jgi:aryl-alcohol dehydrogenase-like predicted oxidoreductase